MARIRSAEERLPIAQDRPYFAIHLGPHEKLVLPKWGGKRSLERI